MKKIFFSITLLVISCSLLSTSFEAETNSPILIESPLLNAMDGSPFIRITSIMHFIANINKLHEAKIDFGAKSYTFHELMHLEEKLSPEKRQKIVSLYLSKFETIAAPYLSDIRGARGMLIELIEHWTTQRNLPNSMLLKWSSSEINKEKDTLLKQITSLTIFDLFLTDLVLFLNDLVNSCPKSFALYRAAEKEYNEQHGNK